jgi:hypothetical protein
MKSFKQYIYEIESMMTYDNLVNILISLGYDKIKKISGNKIAVLVNDNRVTTLEKINKNIKGSIYDRNPSSESSVGRVNISGFSILAKPASKQGSASAGVENEQIIVDTINKRTKTGPINVIFKAKNKKFTVLNCVKAIQVGGDTAGRKKADIVLINSKNKRYPISIKKDNAETWESADSYFGPTALKIIKKAIKDKKTKLVSEGSYFKIEPNIAVEATQAEKQAVVFGSDLENGGAVVTKTFGSSSFSDDGDTLVVDCSHIITSLSDVKGDKDVYFLIRNDKTRKSLKEYPGIRILAVYTKRINQNVVVVKR